MWTTRSTLAALLLALTLLGAPPARAQDGSADGGTPAIEEHQGPAALGLGDLFTAGWSDEWVHRHRHTPDMALLRVTTNFLERELRIDFVNTQLANNAKLVASDFLNGLMAWAPNRRLMLEIIGNYQWNLGKTGAPANGAGVAALVRVQLVDNETQSWSVQYRVSAPNRPIGQTQTSMIGALAGWQDLEALLPPLKRMGLYFSVQCEGLLGPLPKAGARSSDLGYALSLAKTWTPPELPMVGNLTTFLELAGTTDLDGANPGSTVLTITPGVRFWLIPKNSLTFGADLPLTAAPSLSVAWRATYILNF